MAFAARIALLCVLGLATLGSTAGGDFTSLLDRMRAAAGPVWAAHLVSVSRVRLEGQITVVSTDSQGLPLTLQRCAGALCEGSYFDGERLYSVNVNDTALPQSRNPEPYLRSLRLIASMNFLAPTFVSQGGRLDDGGTAMLGGRRYRTIFVVDTGAIPVRLYVDPQSALVRFARDVNGDDTFEYRDYRRIGGLTLPFEVLRNDDVLERYDNRTPVATAFQPPHGLRPAFAGPPEAIATDPKAVSPIFDCEIAGVAVRCLLDSGNSGLSMSSELASRLGAPVAGTFAVRGLGGYSTQVVRAGPLLVGNATYPDAYYVVLNDLRRYGYDVVLGADVIASTKLDIDSMAHTIAFAAAPPANAITIPLSFENFVPVVDVELGTLSTQLAVDTGDESNINLAYDFYAKHPGIFTPTQSRSVSGIGGSGIQQIGEISHVTIGDYRTGPQVIGATQTLHGTAFGHLGAAFLRQFKVQLDYAAGELHLIPRQP